jgi:Phosphofructokinase
LPRRQPSAVSRVFPAVHRKSALEEFEPSHTLDDAVVECVSLHPWGKHNPPGSLRTRVLMIHPPTRRSLCRNSSSVREPELGVKAAMGRDYSIVIVAEGLPGPSGNHVMMGIDQVGFERLGGVSALIAAELEARTGYETRVMILGHLQRGGTPSAFDRVLATRMGIRAAEAAIDGDYGTMVACVGSELVMVPLSSAVAVPRVVPGKRLAELESFLA